MPTPTQIVGKYIKDGTIPAAKLDTGAQSSGLTAKLIAYRDAVSNFSFTAAHSNVVTTQVTAVATTLTPVPNLLALGVYTGAVANSADPLRAIIRAAGTDSSIPDGVGGDVYGVLTELSGVYTLTAFKSDGSSFTFGGTTSIDFFFVEVFNLNTAPASAALYSGVAGVVDATDIGLLNLHLNAGTSPAKHAATQISYSNAGNFNITHTTVQLALADLDAVIAALNPSPTNYTPSAATVAGHLAGIDTELGVIIASSGLAKASAVAAAPASISGTYNNGTLGVGATITEVGNGALPTQDGITLSTNDRLLLAFQGAPAQNGVYTVTQLGDGGNPYILTRTTDFNTTSNIKAGSSVPVNSGTLYGGASFFVKVSPATIGTSAINFQPVKVQPQFLDSQFKVQNASDPTKQLAVDVSGVSTATTRTVTAANRNVALDNITIESWESFTLSSGQAAAKSVTLAHTPKVPANTELFPAGAPKQQYGLDFTVSGTTLSWTGLGLDGTLVTGDVIEVGYLYNG